MLLWRKWSGSTCCALRKRSFRSSFSLNFEQEQHTEGQLEEVADCETRKVLEALVAKRRAEAESGEKHKRKRTSSLSSMFLPAKPTAKIGNKGMTTPLKKKDRVKKEKPKRKPKRVSRMDRYETDDEQEESEEEEKVDEDTTSESDDYDDSEDEKGYKKEPAKKAAVQSKGRGPVKGRASGPSIKGKVEKGKGFQKAKVKPKSKGKSSTSSDEEDDEGDLSDDSWHAVDAENILPDRSKRRVMQPTNYRYINGSDDDEDDDDDSD